MQPMRPLPIATVIEAPRAGTQFHGGDLVEDGYGSVGDGHDYVSAYAFAYEGVRLAHVNVCARARDCGAHVVGSVRCHWRVVWRRAGAHCGLYYVSHLHSHWPQTQSSVALLLRHP
jgi:hypothetical protein